MGRQAKLRKQRQQQTEPSAPVNPQDFVKDFEQRGFSREDTARSPELPDDRDQPQV